MNKDEVPQDNSRTYSGHKKVIYATAENGHYEAVESTGWETEEFVTVMAVEEIEEQKADALQRVTLGVSSTLEYHMYDKRMDLLALSQTTGFFQWQIKRHFRPSVFNRLSNKKLARYSEALGIAIPQLKELPH